MSKFVDYITESNDTAMIKARIEEDEELLTDKVINVLAKYTQNLLDDPKFENASEDYIMDQLKAFIKSKL